MGGFKLQRFRTEKKRRFTDFFQPFWAAVPEAEEWKEGGLPVAAGLKMHPQCPVLIGLMMPRCAVGPLFVWTVSPNTATCLRPIRWRPRPESMGSSDVTRPIPPRINEKSQ